jgi:hypothetical protein
MHNVPSTRGQNLPIAAARLDSADVEVCVFDTVSKDYFLAIGRLEVHIS